MNETNSIVLSIYQKAQRSLEKPGHLFSVCHRSSNVSPTPQHTLLLSPSQPLPISSLCSPRQCALCSQCCTCTRVSIGLYKSRTKKWRQHGICLPETDLIGLIWLSYYRHMHISENGISLCLKAEENWIVYLYTTFPKSYSSDLEHLDPICSWAAVKSAVMNILCKCLCAVLIWNSFVNV